MSRRFVGFLPERSFMTRIDNTALAMVAAVAFCLFVVLFSLIPAGVEVKHGADSGSWLQPAYALLEHGGFVLLENPALPDYYRPPGMTLFGAAAMGIGSEPNPGKIVIAQLILLAASGYLLALCANHFLPGSGIWAMGLYLVNPNTVSTALLVQSETVFTFLILLCMTAFVFFQKNQSMIAAVLCGIALGAATLVRPTSQFLIFCLPLAFVIFSLIERQTLAFGAGNWKKSAVGGVVAAGLSGLMLLPWMAQVETVEGRYTLTTSEITNRYIWDQLIIVEAQKTGGGYQATGARLDAEVHNGITIQHCQQEPLLSQARIECFATLASIGWDKIWDHDLSHIAMSLTRSTAAFLFSGAAGNWHNLIGGADRVTNQDWMDADQTSSLSVLRNLFGGQNPIALAISAICIGFAVGLKLLYGFGCFVLARRGNWGAVMLLVAIPAYFIATTLFLGQSRYRMPAEPSFTIAAGIAAYYLVSVFRSRHA